MKILIIKANPELYNSGGTLNQALFEISSDSLSKHHEVKTTDLASGIFDVQQEQEKYQWADLILYHFPLWWFGVPSVLKNYIDQVFQKGIFFKRVDVYGEGGLLVDKKYMMVVTGNMKESAFGQVPMLKQVNSIDEMLLQPRLANYYVGIKQQLPTFLAEDVVVGDTSKIPDLYRKHLKAVFEL